MKKIVSYFRTWSIIRWLRLVAGLIVIAEAFRTAEYIVSVIGFALVFMALTKAGCDASTNSCVSPLK